MVPEGFNYSHLQCNIQIFSIITVLTFVSVTEFCRLQAMISISGYFYLSTEKLESHFSNLISQIRGKLPSVRCGYQPRTSKGLVAFASPNLKGNETRSDRATSRGF